MRVLIANRGEIAVRIVRACRDLGMSPVVAHSEPDRDTLAVRLADEAFCIGPGPAGQSYLDVGAVLTAATAMRAQAVHPGYGFLSESAEFAQYCGEAGLVFVGPSPEAIAQMGDKVSARQQAERLGVPVVPGRELPEEVTAARTALRDLGGTVMIKAAAGGGGRGMRRVEASTDVTRALELARAEAATAFGDPTLYAERFIERGRHVEVQVFGLGDGEAVALGERDCSVQRRHQKLVEETPCGVLDSATREKILDAALQLTRGVPYVGAGTVEFLYDHGSGEFFFLEMNTRLQVEHGVTEMVTGVDIVRQQLMLAATGTCELGSALSLEPRGHALECRVLAEDPDNGFRPAPGVLREFVAPAGPGVRVDTFAAPGTEVSPYYDSMIAKVLADAPTREQAIARMRRALSEFVIVGVQHNVVSLLSILAHPQFVQDQHHTSWFDEHVSSGPHPCGPSGTSEPKGQA